MTDQVNIGSLSHDVAKLVICNIEEDAYKKGFQDGYQMAKNAFSRNIRYNRFYGGESDLVDWYTSYENAKFIREDIKNKPELLEEPPEGDSLHDPNIMLKDLDDDLDSIQHQIELYNAHKDLWWNLKNSGQTLENIVDDYFTIGNCRYDFNINYYNLVLKNMNEK